MCYPPHSSLNDSSFMGSQPGQGTPLALLGGTQHWERLLFLYWRLRICSRSGNSPSETPSHSAQLRKLEAQAWQVLPVSSSSAAPGFYGISCAPKSHIRKLQSRGRGCTGACEHPGRAELRQPGHGAGTTWPMAGGQPKRHGT